MFCILYSRFQQFYRKLLKNVNTTNYASPTADVVKEKTGDRMSKTVKLCHDVSIVATAIIVFCFVKS